MDSSHNYIGEKYEGLELSRIESFSAKNNLESQRLKINSNKNEPKRQRGL